VGRHSDDQAQAQLSESLAGWRETFPDVELTMQVTPGNPIAVLSEAAYEAQLLVLGSRARGSAAAVLLGSTSRDMLHRATCPVLVSLGHHGPDRGRR
jgi:nucleotide-binding universal stress UspA family protein